METKFFLCNICGNVVVKVVDSGIVPSCCDEEMEEVTPNLSEGKTEYHLPVVERVDDWHVRVKVGKEPHPMTKEHFIQFVYVETSHGGHLHYFEPGQPAEFVFGCNVCKIKAVYAYCNIHGLWKTMIDSKYLDAEKSGETCKPKCC